MSAQFGRLITAMVTPMREDGSVDVELTGILAKALVDAGTESIVSTGSTGEAAALTDEETISVWKATKDAVGPDVAVIAGSTSNNHRRSVELTQHAEKIGLDGILLTAPAYSKPPQSGLIKHFTSIAESTSLPCMLYNIPGRAAVNISADTILELAKISNIIGVKEASNDMAQIGQLIDQSPEGFSVWSGNDTDTLMVMAMGGYGVVSVAGHVVSPQIKKQIESSIAGEVDEAARIHHELMPLIDALFIESNPIPVKYACAKAGISVGEARLPLMPLSKESVVILDRELDRHSLTLG